MTMSNKKWESHRAKDLSEKELDMELEESLDSVDNPSSDNEYQGAVKKDCAHCEALEAKVAELTARLLRLQAEADNRDKRFQRDIVNAHKFALEHFLKELVPVIDNIERALAVPTQGDGIAQKIHEGVAMTFDTLLALIQKFDVELIDPLHQPFNSEFHEAVSMQSAENLGVVPNTVVNVFQKGYVLNGRLVRPAMVVVAK